MLSFLFRNKDLKEKNDILLRNNAELRSRLLVVEDQLKRLRDQWNQLVRRINKLGGENFLQGVPSPSLNLTQSEIKKLLLLCHPDKHGNSTLSNEVTAKLITMRK